MKITILCVSKKSGLYDEAESEYLKRLSKYVDLEIESIIHSDIKSETEKMIAKIKPHDYVIVMDEFGSVINSVGFAELLEMRMNDSVKRIVLIIGGAYGVGEELKSRANYTLSLGKMVWPHALARVMLLEQLYRAHTIIHNIPYHNE
jgi:23S rRNA (pseudouridine1915-N3)-methyltransferase